MVHKFLRWVAGATLVVGLAALILPTYTTPSTRQPLCLIHVQRLVHHNYLPSSGEIIAKYDEFSISFFFSTKGRRLFKTSARFLYFLLLRFIRPLWTRLYASGWLVLLA